MNVFEPVQSGNSRGGSPAREIRVFPSVRAGYPMASAEAVERWVQVAWLMLAEGRAYLEDLEGGRDQPEMQQAAKLRLLEQLADIDNRLSGRIAVPDSHCLALALEYGTHELAHASGAELAQIFSLDEEFGAPSVEVGEVFVFWERLLEAFPGELPDRLVAEGQRDMLVTLRAWAQLSREAGLDIGFLTPFMKDA